MISLIARYTFYFVLYVLIQVLILNNILFLGFINPYLYILFIITLPSTVTKDVTLLIAFVMGIIIDVFSGTPGFNAFATVSVAYIKPFFQKAFGPREEHDFLIPSFRTYGIGMFLQYSASLVLIHHLLFFVVESASLFRIEDVILKTLCCAVFTMLIVISMEFFNAKRR